MIRIPTLIFASTMIVFASFAAKAAELHEFVAGTPILAEEINDNFRLLQSADGIRVNCDSGDSLVGRAFPSTPGLMRMVVSGSCSEGTLALNGQNMIIEGEEGAQLTFSDIRLGPNSGLLLKNIGLTVTDYFTLKAASLYVDGSALMVGQLDGRQASRVTFTESSSLSHPQGAGAGELVMRGGHLTVHQGSSLGVQITAMNTEVVIGEGSIVLGDISVRDGGLRFACDSSWGLDCGAMDGLNISAINSRVAVEAPEPAPLLNIAVANGSFFGSICGDSLALQVAQAGVQSGGGDCPQSNVSLELSTAIITPPEAFSVDSDELSVVRIDE